MTSERTLENALPWDTIPPANYNKLNLVQPYLALLRERSDARVATNQDFIYIRQDIAEIQEIAGRQIPHQHAKPCAGVGGPQVPAGMPNHLSAADMPVALHADDVATLNEHEALKEREKIVAQNKAREAERDARKAPDEKIYELTVENCDQPGLPPLPGQTNEVAATGATNAVSAAPEKKSPPQIDPMLDETENILEDYVSLLSKSNILIANHPDL